MRLPPKPQLLVPAGAEDTETARVNYDAAVAYLDTNYAYLPDPRGRGGAAAKRTRDAHVTSIGSLRDEWVAYCYETVGPRGGIKKHHPIDQWAALAERVAGFQCRPDLPGPLFEDPASGRRYVNTWVPFEHPAKGGTIKVFTDFMEGLIPDQREREWYLDRIAHKLQRPDVPGIAALQVASREQGTGRTTLYAILSKLIGEVYTSTVQFDDLVGGNYNSHVTKLWVFVQETAMHDDNRISAKQGAMERLKYVIDTRSRIVTVNHKWGAKGDARTFTTYDAASNHNDAVSMTDEERRICVLANGPARSPEFYRRLNKWMEDPVNIGALHRWLMARDVSGFSPFKAIDTDLREHMLAASTSELDEAVGAAIADMPGEIMQINQVMRLTDTKLKAEGHFLPGSWMIPARKIAQRMLCRVPGSDKPKLFARSLLDARKWRGVDAALVKAQLDRNEKKLSGSGARFRLDIVDLEKE